MVCALGALFGIAILASGCAQHAQTTAELERALERSRQQAGQERNRVLALEARLLRLEYEAALEKPEALDTQRSPSTSIDQRLVERLDMLIALNQSLLQRSLAEQSPAAHAIEPAAAPAPAEHLTPECEAGLSTEQKIRQLVLQLRGQRSPWRVDGLSYEESEALRFLLREERQLDRHNPWQ